MEFAIKSEPDTCWVELSLYEESSLHPASSANIFAVEYLQDTSHPCKFAKLTRPGDDGLQESEKLVVSLNEIKYNEFYSIIIFCFDNILFYLLFFIRSELKWSLYLYDA